MVMAAAAAQQMSDPDKRLLLLKPVPVTGANVLSWSRHLGLVACWLAAFDEFSALSLRSVTLFTQEHLFNRRLI